MSNIFDRIASGNDRRESLQAPPPENDSGAVLRETDEHLGSERPEANRPNSAGVAQESKTPAEIKTAVQELLKSGFIEEEGRSDLFQCIRIHESAIQKALEPLDLEVKLDTHRGVAFLRITQQVDGEVSMDEGWSHPLVRRQRLTLEQSLIIAILRQSFVMHEQESGVGHSPAKMAIDELLPQFLVYFGDTGSDSKNESRLVQLLDQLKGYGLVSEVDKKQEVTIRPLIAHLANPESLQSLLQIMKDQGTRSDDAEREER
ncbi:hypothetical protein VN12_19970 [Pirellula sp. SH-Sr6A]|uniref:DUF4194 domain-containing protein n=1 Tax=Pirellula sp. SH-Sr6A TaxID=1632865 RepID=UPI00078CFF59|nr:DUF4194 domain-containing protein [Pirellula sp. SH-Sr6A]AMV34412.1 hypothetical protein VN12_19970 [Pirellula sp. SH-Sr6A]